MEHLLGETLEKKPVPVHCGCVLQCLELILLKMGERNMGVISDEVQVEHSIGRQPALVKASGRRW